MRILAYFGGRLLESRGTPSRARNLCRALASLPDVELLALSADSGDDTESDLGFDQVSIESIEDRPRALRRAIAEFEPGVVYGHTHKAMVEMRALPTGGSTRIVDLHGHVAFEKLEAPDRSVYQRLKGYTSARIADARGLRSMDAFTSCSNPLADLVRKTGRPVRVIWGGADPQLFRPRADAPRGQLRIAYAGNFRPYQGVDVLLEACKRLLEAGEAFELSLVGDIDRFPDFKRLVLDQLPGHVEIHGQIDYQRMPEVLTGANVLVIPRPAHRTAQFGFPSKLAEYLAMERATIATRVGDLARAVQDNQTGLLVAPGSVDELYEALLRLKDNDLRSRLAAAGRRYAEEHLSWPALARQVESFLREVHTERG